MFNEKILMKKDEMIKDLETMIRIPSKLEGYNNPDYPFGKNVDDALNTFLKIGERMGFRTKNINKHCGYIEFGEGGEILGIVGHLDVVPEGEGWTYPPFELTNDDDVLYGRGTIDDKGPMIASLYAMKVVMDNCKVNKRVRLIVGLNEESDWKCINYYKEHEELPTLGFSPDADFPCIYAEKALLTVYVSSDYCKNEKIEIKEFDCKNNRVNVVPKYCACTISVSDTIVNQVKKILMNRLSGNLSFTQKENEFYIESRGIQAHAAHPELGKNAVSQMIMLLNEIFNYFDIEEKMINTLASKIQNETNGTSLGIKYEDKELGDLTLNLANIELSEGIIKAGMNLRIPGSCDLEDVKKKIENGFNRLNVEYAGEMKALYIPKDNELIKTLLKIYNDYTGENREPITIGGATFARAFNNCVSFGAMRPDEPDMCHQVDEYITVKNLIDACNIYAIAIYELAK